MIRKDETSYKQTKYGILPRHKVLKLEVIGTRKGLLLLNRLAKENKAISPDLIKQVYKESFSEILVDGAGKFRIIQVTYSGKEAPHFSKISEMIKVLCNDTEYTIAHLPKPDEETFIERVVELLAHFQHRFVFIHPFVDYNGRTARMFTSYILMRLNLPIIEIKADTGKSRKDYITTMKKADKGDYSKLEDVISNALNESLQKAVKE